MTYKGHAVAPIQQSLTAKLFQFDLVELKVPAILVQIQRTRSRIVYISIPEFPLGLKIAQLIYNHYTTGHQKLGM